MTQQRTALITGGSRGLGLSLATALAQRGWSLIITGRDEKALEQACIVLAQHTRITAIAGDVTSTAHREMLEQAAMQRDGIDLLVNNASTLGASPLPSLLEFPLEVLEQVYRTNVIAPLGVFQAVQPHLRDGAAVFNITSDASVEPYAGWGGYGSSKAALDHLSAILAEEHPDLRIYWIDPGDMRTQMHQEAFPGEDISDRPLPEDSVPGLLQLLDGNYPSGRYQAKAIDQDPVSELRVVLHAEHFDEAVRFYRDGLNLPIEGGWDDPNGRGTVFVAGQATIEVIDTPQAERLEAVEAIGETPSQIRLAFRVNDLDQTSDQITAIGAEAVREPIVTTWGHRSQRFNSPGSIALTLFRDTEADETPVVEGVS
jgi:NAD(P)-dependent dehydrogenase (short-subunit alcohol dehydrogenase family)